MDTVQKAFGNRLRELRQEQCLTQEELSHRAGLNRTYIGDIERGEKNLTLASIEKLARVLGVKIRDFFDWEYLFSNILTINIQTESHQNPVLHSGRGGWH
ncbi:helix-turn-helix transcriptional regulator [Thalassotalea sp. G20_0]|uniref:helix-turn-helix domain-containing protein n=1 Tax=Thalassotalea sp. G20_0 TaxID=2821093 RepID=UPI001ADA4738|nr:helix-turn-helix transcriptional regulator [Thalassotalea sp. G20_0]MBO9494780.1 helix-turn-helix transcriptional regulator [Thalassotalea sp. G20_0]